MTVRVSKPEFNLREKLSELDKPTGVKGLDLMGSDTTQDARSFISAGRKNYIINGDFQVSQRGDYTSATTASNQAYYLDRWTVDASGVGATIQHKTNQLVGNSSGDYYKNTVTMAATSSATGYLQLRQKMELHKSLFGKTVTVSAWVKSNHPNIRLRTEGGWYGSGNNWDSLQSHNGDGRWQKLSMTIRLKSNPSYLVFGIILWGSTGGPPANHAQAAIKSGDYYEFTDFQVEIGENATDFEHRTFAEEYELCQRYFQSNFPVGVPPQNGYYSTTQKLAAGFNGAVSFSSNNARSPWVMFHPKMRVEPDVTLYAASNDDTDNKWAAYKGSWNSDAGNPIDKFGSNGFGVRFNSASGSHAFVVGEAYLYRGMWAADAEL